MQIKMSYVCRAYSLQQRLRLFDSVISPCFLYGCEAWTSTVELERKITKTQRHMLRKIIGKRRRQTESGELELWADWLKRTTHEIESHCEKLCVEDWVATVRRRTWQWAGQVLRQSDMRWSYIALDWEPDKLYEQQAWRKQARPCKRWSDMIAKFWEDRYGMGAED